MKTVLSILILVISLFIATPMAEAEEAPTYPITENIVKDLLGFQDSAARILLQYLLPPELRPQNNAFALPFQVEISSKKEDFQISIQYRITF